MGLLTLIWWRGLALVNRYSVMCAVRASDGLLTGFSVLPLYGYRVKFARLTSAISNVLVGMSISCLSFDGS